MLLPGARVMEGCRVVNAILGERAVVEKNVDFGSKDADTAVAGNDAVITKGEE